MTLMLTPDLSIPLPPAENLPIDLMQRIAAAANTIDVLIGHGLDAEPSPTTHEDAAKLATAYAADPAKTSKTVTAAKVATLLPAVLLEARSILDEFGSSVVRHSVEIRHLVTNKLLLETENPDPRIRLRALELLGKHSDVGLFTERSEVTITHQSTDDLQKKLRDKLNRLMNRGTPEDVEDANVVEMQGDSINVSDELGLSEPQVG